MEDNRNPSCPDRIKNRRGFLAGAALGVLGGTALGWFARLPAFPGTVAEAPNAGEGYRVPGIPGPFPGRVVEVNHPAALGTVKTAGYTDRNPEVVRAMMARGMKELVGCDDAVEAWRFFFAPRDRVGIKVVPVGKPDSISSYEVVRAAIDGLVSAGVRPRDILVFERYRDEFLASRYHENLPDGVYWAASSAGFDESQLDMHGQLAGKPIEDRVVGYDPHIFREMAYCQPWCDPNDDRRFRSHLSAIVSQMVDKFISIPVLKDHRSSGVSLALKNLSHGLANNVARSHIIYRDRDPAAKGGTLNQCGTFIPTVASLPAIKQKAVLQILDGLVATWEGGPRQKTKTFATWPYQSLFFATDPVALDRVGWEIIDRKRVAEGWPGVAAMGLDARTGIATVDGKPYPEELHIRQPQHIALAETLGMGIFDRARIDHRRLDLS